MLELRQQGWQNSPRDDREKLYGRTDMKVEEKKAFSLRDGVNIHVFH